MGNLDAKRDWGMPRTRGNVANAAARVSLIGCTEKPIRAGSSFEIYFLVTLTPTGKIM